MTAACSQALSCSMRGLDLSSWCRDWKFVTDHGTTAMSCICALHLCNVYASIWQQKLTSYASHANAAHIQTFVHGVQWVACWAGSFLDERISCQRFSVGNMQLKQTCPNAFENKWVAQFHATWLVDTLFERWFRYRANHWPCVARDCLWNIFVHQSHHNLVSARKSWFISLCKTCSRFRFDGNHLSMGWVHSLTMITMSNGANDNEPAYDACCLASVMVPRISVII